MAGSPEGFLCTSDSQGSTAGVQKNTFACLESAYLFVFLLLVRCPLNLEYLQVQVSRVQVGSKYVWIILGDYASGWWRARDPDVSCSPGDLQGALHGYITTEILPVASQDRVTVSNLVSTDEYDSVFNHTQEHPMT